ncbi:MAG TPA: twin-arginine translocase subunit TatC [Candidatus Azoamicus sp. OHIO2]
MNIHLLELRQRLIFCIYFFTLMFLILFYFSDILYDLFSLPIKTQTPNTNALIAIKVTSTFMIPLKLAFYIAFSLSTPYFIFNIWRFITPGLYRNERTSILPYLFLSIILFFIGIAFAFYIICPIALNFFLNCSPSNVTVMIGLDYYMDFMFTIILGAGISFQIPIIINVIIRLNLTTKQQLIEKRAYIIVLAFIIGMILTPPDVISQIMLAIPICILFELGLFFSK